MCSQPIRPVSSSQCLQDSGGKPREKCGRGNSHTPDATLPVGSTCQACQIAQPFCIQTLYSNVYSFCIISICLGPFLLLIPVVWAGKYLPTFPHLLPIFAPSAEESPPRCRSRDVPGLSEILAAYPWQALDPNGPTVSKGWIHDPRKPFG
jgi:hypothetical protein